MSTTKDLDRLLQGFVDGGLPGCSLQIAQRGNVLYEGYFGYADLDAKAPGHGALHFPFGFHVENPPLRHHDDAL